MLDVVDEEVEAILRAAREVVRERWIQGSYCRTRHGEKYHCAVGAVGFAIVGYRKNPWTGQAIDVDMGRAYGVRAFERTIRLLYSLLPKCHQLAEMRRESCHFPEMTCIEDWNDKCAGVEPVLDLFTRALEKC